MSHFSDQTLGLLAQVAPDYFTHTGLETLLLTYGLDDDSRADSMNKQKLLLDAIRRAKSLDHPGEALSGLIGEVAKRVRTREPRTQSDRERAFMESLRNDGWTVRGQQLVRSERPKDPDVQPSGDHASVIETVLTPGASDVASSNEVFIVHGRDISAKDAVARFVERLGFKSIVLHERDNRGLTILEKFLLEASNAAFAIVLMSADDSGGVASEVAAGRFNSRARQNVIFEFGYFVGILGRNRVVALVPPEVETPSDIAGLIYIPFDSTRDDWKTTVAREMRAAGLMVDLNRL